MIKSGRLSRRPSRRASALVASMMALAACVSPVAGPGGRYAKPVGGAPVIANPTPYTKGLVCMGHYARTNEIRSPRIAVGRIIDYTGQIDIEGGRRITQGASLMAITAFAKSGARLVERFDTSVSELELKYANNKLIGDQIEDVNTFRQINAGSIPGSDFYLVGGITELNQNIRSSALDFQFGDVDPLDPVGNAGGRLFVVNVGVDLRLVETQSLEVIDVISYQKQVIGREISAGFFDFFGGNVFDIGAAERAQEPLQLAVRAVIERSVLEMMANLYGAPSPDVCRDLPKLVDTHGKTGDFIQVEDNLTTNNGRTRSKAKAWHARRDKRVRKGLRGRQEVIETAETAASPDTTEAP